MHDSKTQGFILQYAPALVEYLARGDEDSLQRARNLGRLAGRSAIPPHQLVLIHATALLDCEPSINVHESTFPFEFLAQALIALEQESAAPEFLDSACTQGLGVRCMPFDAVLTSNDVVAVTRRRREFLADLSRRIVKSPDPKAEFSAVVELAVPEIAGCSAVHWIDAEGQPILTAVKGSSVQVTTQPWCEGSQCRSLLRKSLESGKVNFSNLDGEQAFQMASDNQRRGRAVVVPLIADGQVLGAVTLCWGCQSGDIRFEQEFGEQLACCTQRAFESARYRTIAQGSYQFMDQYLGRVVHDLSTPLATLSMVLELGLDRVQRGDAPNERTFRKALSQVEQMTTMIKELVDATGETLAKAELEPVETGPSGPKTTKYS